MSTLKPCKKEDIDSLIVGPLFEQSKFVELFDGSLIMYDENLSMTV